MDNGIGYAFCDLVLAKGACGERAFERVCQVERFKDRSRHSNRRREASWLCGTQKHQVVVVVVRRRR